MAGFDPTELMKAAQRMQEELARVQGELARKTVEASAGGGLVTVTANGKLEVLAVHIDPSVVDPKDVGMLQDLVAAATNQALARARELVESAMRRAAGQLGLPLPPGIGPGTIG